MIDTNLYRYRIGTFYSRQRQPSGKAGNSIPDYGYNLIKLFTLMYIFVFIYYLLGMVCFLFSIASSDCKEGNGNNLNNPIFYQIKYPAFMSLNKLMYTILIKFIFCRIYQRKSIPLFNHYLYLHWSSPLRVSLLSKSPNCFCRLVSGLYCWTFLINFCLITIVNPSLLNPGPQRGNSDLTVAFQNVTGLIPFSELGKPNPKLDTIKILELNSYICKFKPGIVILNETWLKGSIDDGEVIPKDQYKMFRR